jgi:hypothetical protein
MPSLAVTDSDVSSVFSCPGVVILVEQCPSTVLQQSREHHRIPIGKIIPNKSPLLIKGTV